MMKKSYKVLLACALFSALGMQASAAERETTREIAVPAEIQEAITSSVVHENGEISRLQPQVKMYQTLNSYNLMHGAEKQEFALKIYQPYDSRLESDSGYDSAAADASVFVEIVYSVIPGTTPNVLQEVHVEYTRGSEVQVYNRTVKYGTVNKDMRTVNLTGMTFDRTGLEMSSDGINGFMCNATAKVESYGVTDTLAVTVRKWG